MRLRVLNAHGMGLNANEPQDGAIYIGRRTRNGWRQSKWANPYRIGRDGTRAECIARYEADLRCDLVKLAECKMELGGRDLLCWCSPEPCHGDVLLRLANGG